jgi:hypothetical protein
MRNEKEEDMSEEKVEKVEKPEKPEKEEMITVSKKQEKKRKARKANKAKKAKAKNEAKLIGAVADPAAAKKQDRNETKHDDTKAEKKIELN